MVLQCSRIDLVCRFCHDTKQEIPPFLLSSFEISHTQGGDIFFE
ncbi:hypothetical protein X949_4366 [Burkholderia pseudomallei MSHR5609]|nr:hypothetical protein X992_4548 [Burkholderia pseudomallei MSHR5492]KGS56457.1 hypothetical protein X949_4366 [Burkholderia pseudomallei MSHR5609]